MNGKIGWGFVDLNGDGILIIVLEIIQQRDGNLDGIEE
jgi:hypothetical protein